VNLGARAAGAGVAHHPEIVLLVAVDDVNLGIEAGLFEDAGPDVVGFLVQLGRLALAGLVDGGKEALRRDAPDLGEQLPAPGERVLLEVVSEGPVAQHLEHRVVVGVEADVLEVVVLAAGADAFLRVGHARRIPGRLLLTKKDRDELVHAGVCEKQIGRIGQERRRRHDCVLFLAKEIEKRLSDLRRGHEGKNAECRMPNAELMTKSEAKKQSPGSNASSFDLRDSFVIRNSCFVISNFVDLTMGKLPKLAQNSK
jgi:hypothetical protein